MLLIVVIVFNSFILYKSALILTKNVTLANRILILQIIVTIRIHANIVIDASIQQAPTIQENSKSHAPVPEERLGYRFMVRCNHLEFNLTAERNGERGNVSGLIKVRVTVVN